MGNCSSCLGNRRQDVYEEDDESRLLFDDPNGVHYGSFGEQQMNGHEDPQEVQREIEALQRVVARTSDNMVDIYEIAPHDRSSPMHEHAVVAAPFAYVGQEARMARYQNLLSKLSQDELAAEASVDWDVRDEDDAEDNDNNDENIEMMTRRGVLPPRPEAAAPAESLVGNFTDAAAAMR